jgi:hypothetical protein
VLFTACEQSVGSAPEIAPAQAILEGAVIEGALDAEMEPQNLRLVISGQQLKLAITGEADLSAWITNIPAGLSAHAQTLFPSGGTEVIITITGTPKEERTGPVTLTIPEGYLTEYKALPAQENPYARFDIVKPEAKADNITLFWTSGEAPLEETLTITLLTGTFRGIGAGAAVTWITNLPAGLQQAVQGAVAEGSQTVQIRVYGTPTAAGSGALAITIPAEALSGNAAIKIRANKNVGYTILIGGDPGSGGDPGTTEPALVRVENAVTINGVRTGRGIPGAHARLGWTI